MFYIILVNFCNCGPAGVAGVGIIGYVFDVFLVAGVVGVMFWILFYVLDGILCFRWNFMFYVF